MSEAPDQSTAMTTVYTERQADLVVADRQEAADGVVTIKLADPTGAELPAWTPGAHIDLLLAPQLTRQYSLCGSPADRQHYRVGVLRDPNSRGGSQRVHDAVQTGAVVSVRGPRNHFPLIASERYLFVAGGIGITPILPMIASATLAGADWQLFYGGRSRQSMALLDELAAYGDRV